MFASSSLFGSYNLLSSCHIWIPGNDIISLELFSNKSIVKYELTSVDFSTENVWIGLFDKSENRLNYYKYYKYIYEKAGEIEFPLLQKQIKWEARLISDCHQGALSLSNSVSH